MNDTIEAPWGNYVPIVTVGRTTTVNLTSNIEAPGAYDELVSLLYDAYEGDKFIFDINNDGGNSASAFRIIAAMHASKATIHGRLSGLVASAATVVTMACDTIEVTPYTQFMVHNYFHTPQGTGNQVKEYVNFTDREFIRAVREIYRDFLTDVEMKQVSEQDKELWFNDKEILVRWDRKVGCDVVCVTGETNE